MTSPLGRECRNALQDRQPSYRLTSLFLLLIGVLGSAPALALDGWTVRMGDPDTLIAPLDIQIIPGTGEEPTLVAILDPASNSHKVRLLDLDGHPGESAPLGNGPDPWQSGLRPFGGFSGPQLPLGAWRGGGWEAVQGEDALLNVMEVDPTTGQLRAMQGQSAEARHPGDLPLLPFEAQFWGGDPVDGTVYCAGASGVYRFAGSKGSRLPIAVREDWLHLETGPDGTFALLDGPGHNSLQITARMYDSSGMLKGTSTPAGDLSGAMTILDQAHAGAQGGWLLLALVQAPYPVSLTQHLNDATRVLLQERESMPFLFRFDWDDGALAALTPLPDLPADLELARVSADSQSAILLVRSPEKTYLTLMALGNLASFGDIPLSIGKPLLQQPRGMVRDTAGKILVLDQGYLDTSSIPVVSLVGEDLADPIALVPLPTGTRLDLGGLTFDREQTLWWGGQVVDPEGVRGAIWQRCDREGTVLNPALFELLPRNLFALDDATTTQLPWLLAQAPNPDGGMLAIAGTFEPPQSWLLHLDSANDPTPERLPLPGDAQLLEFATLQLLVAPDSSRILTGRSPQQGIVQVWWQGHNDTSWESPELLPSLGAWPIGVREGGDWVWVLPGLGLIESDAEERLLRLAANPSPWLEAVSQGDTGMNPNLDTDLLLLRQVGQVWEVSDPAWRDVEDKGAGRVNDALLELDQAIRKYYTREGQFPPEISAAFLASDLRDYTWSTLWELFIGARPLQYRHSDAAFDLVVWGANADQTLYHVSERGIVPIDPVAGFVPAEKRGSLLEAE